jgi:branched-subunit amino acid aminotransferase/4-amino-4-deoxychorismate lyase
MLVWLNGRTLDARAARVSALDRGLLHGDGCYDTWRAYDGVPFATAAHVRRLTRTVRALGLPAIGAEARWHARTARLVAANGLRDAAIRLTVTRGDTGDTLLPSRRGRPTLLLTVRPLPPDLEAQRAQGIRAILLPFSRNAGPHWARYKLLGHASAVRGRQLAARRGAAEGIYVSADGEATEGTSSNLFAIRRGVLLTPPRTSGILGGVTRDLVLRLARRAGVRVRERRLPASDLASADEIFVTASTIEVLPIVRLGRRRVGGGVPGPLTRMLQERYRQVVLRRCARADGRS